MTTLQEAKQAELWTIAAKLVSKLIFVKRRDGSAKIGLILVFIDITGQPFEIKIWRDLGGYERLKKIFTVYRKVNENDCYEIQSKTSGHHFRSPNVEFSTSKLEYTRWWWIEPINSLKLNRYLDCSTNIQSSLSDLRQQKPVNLLGSFVSLKKGPITHVVRGRPSIQGYFVTLTDDRGETFVALVWHSVRIDRNRFSLFHCDKGEPVLLFSARLGHPLPGSSKDLISVTTTYQPVVNSKCVSPKRINALKDSTRSIRSTPIAYAASAY